jgi:SAM-dependent methyltransferase
MPIPRDSNNNSGDESQRRPGSERETDTTSEKDTTRGRLVSDAFTPAPAARSADNKADVGISIAEISALTGTPAAAAEGTGARGKAGAHAESATLSLQVVGAPHATQDELRPESIPAESKVLRLPARNHSQYAKHMIAVGDLKNRDILPQIPSDARVIVDIGCGPGQLIDNIAVRHPDAKVIGLELSPELREMAREANKNNAKVKIVAANALTKELGNDRVDAVILSSVAHEFRSYSKEDKVALDKALVKLHDHLRPGGRLIIRDPISPGFTEKAWIKCDAATEQLFLKFAKDFRPNSPEPGVPYQVHTDAKGQTWYGMSKHHANEFLQHKNYPDSWNAEMMEEYGTYDLAGWKNTLEKAGFRVTEAKQYLNPWIRDNWYKDKVELRTDDGGKPGKLEPYPATNVILVGEAIKADSPPATIGYRAARDAERAAAANDGAGQLGVAQQRSAEASDATKKLLPTVTIVGNRDSLLTTPPNPVANSDSPRAGTSSFKANPDLVEGVALLQQYMTDHGIEITRGGKIVDWHLSQAAVEQAVSYYSDSGQADQHRVKAINALAEHMKARRQDPALLEQLTRGIGAWREQTAVSPAVSPDAATVAPTVLSISIGETAMPASATAQSQYSARMKVADGIVRGAIIQSLREAGLEHTAAVDFEQRLRSDNPQTRLRAKAEMSRYGGVEALETTVRARVQAHGPEGHAVVRGLRKGRTILGPIMTVIPVLMGAAASESWAKPAEERPLHVGR